MLHGSFSRVCFPGTSDAAVISSANPIPLKQEEEARKRESFEFRKLDFSRWPRLTVMSIFVALAPWRSLFLKRAIHFLRLETSKSCKGWVAKHPGLSNGLGAEAKAKAHNSYPS